MVKVRVLLRHSIGNLRHYVRLEPNSLVQTQEAVLAKWDQNSLNVSDFTLPVLMELTNIAVDDDGVRSRHCIATFCLESPASASPILPLFPPPHTHSSKGKKIRQAMKKRANGGGKGPGRKRQKKVRAGQFNVGCPKPLELGLELQTANIHIGNPSWWEAMPQRAWMRTKTHTTKSNFGCFYFNQGGPFAV